MIRVLLADDQALVRAGFRSLLDAQDDIRVVGEAGDGEECVRLSAELAPDVVLMDIRMPGVDGLEATRRIAGDDRLAGVKVVILTTFGLDEYVFEAIRSGASGFLVKDTEPADCRRPSPGGSSRSSRPGPRSHERTTAWSCSPTGSAR
jgi:DNA-binding NarL/FixJ family response regulator